MPDRVVQVSQRRRATRDDTACMLLVRGLRHREKIALSLLSFLALKLDVRGALAWQGKLFGFAFFNPFLGQVSRHICIALLRKQNTYIATPLAARSSGTWQGLAQLSLGKFGICGLS